jgi:hypothetical protein
VRGDKEDPNGILGSEAYKRRANVSYNLVKLLKLTTPDLLTLPEMVTGATVTDYVLQFDSGTSLIRLI